MNNLQKKDKKYNQVTEKFREAEEEWIWSGLWNNKDVQIDNLDTFILTLYENKSNKAKNRAIQATALVLW